MSGEGAQSGVEQAPAYRWLLVAAAILVGALYLAPAWHGEEVIIPIHDILDSEMLFYKLRAESGMWWDPRVITETEFPFHSLRSPLVAMTHLFRVFPPHLAYVINDAIVHFVAVLGLGLFLERFARRYFPGPLPTVLLLGASVAFGLIPFYSLYGLAVAGQPLLALAMWRLADREASAWDWLIIALFPFYSFFAVVSPFLLCIAVVFIALVWLRQRRFPLAPVIATGIYLTLALLAEHSLLLNSLHPEAPESHRVEMPTKSSPAEALALWSSEAALLWPNGHYHAGLLPLWLPLSLGVLALAGGTISRRFRPGTLAVGGLLAMIVAMIAGPGLLRWFLALLPSDLPLVSSFQFSRFYFLIPVTASVLLFASLCELTALVPAGAARRVAAVAAVGAIVAQSAWLLTTLNPALAGNYRKFTERRVRELSFRDFYAPDLWRLVKDATGDRRIICVGIHPAVARWNGLNTVDGYANSYPLAYKHRFRRIIEPELARSESMRTYFDEWGSRCYVLTAQLEKNFVAGKRPPRTLDVLLNPQGLAENDVDYVASALPIKDPQRSGLELVRGFEHSSRFFDVFLYRRQ